mgnify:CR=1 FL=1
MSVSSAMSGLSVSMNGDEISFDTAVTETFKQIQTNLNNCENNIYGLATADDRGDFRYSYELQKKIEFNLSEMLLLFKDLKSVVRQIKLKPTNDGDRDWVKSFDVEFANQKKEQ